MDYNVKLELAKQYLRDRKKYIAEQAKDDDNRFIPTAAVETDIRRTINDFKSSQFAAKKEGTSQTVRFFDRKLRVKK